MDFSRREFLRSTAVGTTAASLAFNFRLFQEDIPNPLAAYPNRGWEKVYRDQYKYDSSFTYVCSPNDTHACRIRAFVRNGVMMRAEPNYDLGRYTDLYGNKATANWNPRMCLKGYTFHRRLYGPYRLRYPLVRKGWKRWADDGFPYLTPALRTTYKFDSRGTDEFMTMAWDEAMNYAARGYVAIAKTYSGDEGRKRLLDEGYTPEMVDATEGSGVRCMKHRGGMGLLGAIGKYGMYRFSNTLALLDATVRGVGPEKAKGGRNWDNYTWHGDQAPGHPFVHGLQASEVDMNELRFTKLHIHAGKNLVENKMPDSHWFIESMERGAKIWNISPEYAPPSTKADHWLPVRPETDAALFLYCAKYIIDNKHYDTEYILKYTDLPLLVRTDTLKRLTAKDIGVANKDIKSGQSYTVQGLKDAQRDKLGDVVVWDTVSNKPVTLSRDDVGRVFEKLGVKPALEGKYSVTVDGKPVEVFPLFELYKLHLKDYDLDTVAEITNSPKHLIEQMAKDLATIKPAAIHVGEGINHWFHATEVNRATYLPLMLTGNVGIPGGGSHTWAGNYKMALFQGSPWSGDGFKVYIGEDPFHPNLDPNVDGKEIHAHAYTSDEGVAYWNHGDKPLVWDTPKFGRKMFTGKSHMPTPTKSIWFTNVNLINNAKWAYEMIKNVNPKIDLIMSTDIEMTASVEYADFAWPANSWVEQQQLEMTASCSNPFLQIWGGTGMKPLYNTKDDVVILATMAKTLGEVLGDKRFEEYWKFALEGKSDVYIQRVLDASSTTRGYKLKDIMEGKFGEPGACLLNFRTYPRMPFWEMLKNDYPFYTPTGRLQCYNDEKEVLDCGENFIVHREGPESTPYLPNVIVSSNPYIRAEDYGIDEKEMHWDARHVRNIKKPWSEVKNTKNPLWEKGYQFYFLTPKSRHRVHSQWSSVDWHMLWDSNFSDPYRVDKRLPHVTEHQVHMNPQAATDLGIKDGDYVYVDANPADRPYIGWKPDDPFYKVARLMMRVKYNPAYPYNCIMAKHAPYMATERSVKAHETRPDGRALSEGTGYQANVRYGSPQSCTRSWLMPMHQTDSLFHKAKLGMFFIFGGEADNHMVNTVPKETLVKITKAEDGGIGGVGSWEIAKTGRTPGAENALFNRYLAGDLTKNKED